MLLFPRIPITALVIILMSWTVLRDKYCLCHYHRILQPNIPFIILYKWGIKVSLKDSCTNLVTDMILYQVHDTFLVHCLQMCEILHVVLLRSKEAVKTSSETWFLTIYALWPWLRKHDLESRSWLWVVDKTCVKYSSNPSCQWKCLGQIFALFAIWPWPWT